MTRGKPARPTHRARRATGSRPASQASQAASRAGAQGVPDVLGSTLGFNLNRVAVLFRRRLIRTLRRWGFSPEQWQVLAAVVAAGREELSQSDLAAITLKDRHAISRMLDRMERDGWVARRAQAGDARSHAIHASAKARRELPEVRRALTSGFADVLGVLDAPAHAQLLRSILRLIQVLEQR